MLTPCKHDKNRKSELKRRKVDGASFGAVHEKAVKEQLAKADANLNGGATS